MYQRRSVLHRTDEMNIRLTEHHCITNNMVIRDAEALASQGQQIADDLVDQTIPDRANPIGLGEKLKVGEGD